MVLEATVLIVDNSEYARNGDFPRTRFEAQIDAVEFIFQAKRNSNPENTVALLSSAGENPRVLSTFTTEFGKILSGLHETLIQGSIQLCTAIQVAALTLKHRQNKVQHQRIIAFVCSPIPEEHRDDLLKQAKKLKKNNIAIDIINFGESETNEQLLNEFIELANKGNPQGDSNEDVSHLLSVSPNNIKLLYEVIASSPIILENSGMGGYNDGFGAANGMDSSLMDFGVDPSMDPELAMALRLSMEEEQQRQERLRQEQQQPQDNNESNN
ncbi:26S proteasome regulatory subunit RPN10 [Nakaseomyces glabratus]|nr:26S proteasome regulatory subunit RPN10 [Nakaseomyces glabratus]KTB27073.1 26S proteasome regulatory subunit RPN10 [Nakaseomyces glabratus]